MAEFQSILFGAYEAKLKKEMPDFFKDLQLDYLVERILEYNKGYQTGPYFYTLPCSEALILYRQQVGKDMESEPVCAALNDFCRRLSGSREFYQFSLECKGELATATYHLQAATLYRDALQLLAQELKGLEDDLNSEGMQEFARYIELEMETLRKNGFEEALNVANSFFSKLKFSLSLDADKLMLTEQHDGEASNYFTELAKLLGQEPEEKKSALTDIFPDPLEISYLEKMLVGLLKRCNPQVFEEIKNFKERFPKIYPEIILKFEEEVQFYLSFQKFKIRTGRMGYPMCSPRLSEDGRFFGREVYDIALAWKQEFNNYEVVSNNFSMKEHPCFFVVTGPNQGGKTTFARSLGQAVYFSLMGLPANGESFTMPYLNGISTHFEAEETLQSNSGKLKEEINRLIPMMSRLQNRKHFVILNELFTTATTHDAMIMGRRVMESFLERECYGIYVTHIQELAEETDEIISLVAQLEPGQEIKRSYRILPMKAQGYGYSDALVRKFHLEYEDIIRRLS